MQAQAEFEVHRPQLGDERAVVAALGEWMDPQRAAQLLPGEYLTRFAETSLVAHSADGEVAGFVVAFPSRTAPEVAYVHFIWVAPQFRGRGLGRVLYEGACDLLRSRGCRLVEAVTSPRNPGAAAFHEHLGFDRDAQRSGADIEPSAEVVVFTRRL